VFVRANDGNDAYNNRVEAFLELRGMKLVRWEDYEDTERTAALDATLVP
jgi:hypothetical protein